MDQFGLITRNLQEVINPEHLKNVLTKRQPKGYWGTAPTGSIHIGYLVPLLKLKDIVDAGCHLTILIADIHAFLDDLKTPYEKISYRTKYYIEILKAVLTHLGVDLEKVNFVKGSSYQLNPEVTMELYRLANRVTANQAIKAGTEVVKQNKNPKLTSLIYPLLQALDEKFLDVDFEIGGVDQRKIFALSMDFLERENITYLLNPIIPGLSSKKSIDGSKMSASNGCYSKIDLLEKPSMIMEKIKMAYCPEGEILDNSVLALYRNLVFKLTDKLTFYREPEYGSDLEFSNYESLEKLYLSKEINPVDLKQNLANFLSEYLKPIRTQCLHPDFLELYAKAYW